MPLYGPLHNYIEVHRERSGLSQAELAFLIGIGDGSSVSRYELGERTPNLESMLALEFVFAQPMRRLYLGVADGVRESVRSRARTLLESLGDTPSNELALKLDVLSRLVNAD